MMDANSNYAKIIQYEIIQSRSMIKDYVDSQKLFSEKQYAKIQ